MIEFLNLNAGERVDLTDMQFALQDSQLAMGRLLPEGFLVDGAKQALWVIRGFTLANPTGQVLRVKKGSAVMALRQGTRITQGILTADGDETADVDLSSFSGATYNVYVRFILTLSRFDTRTFWNASGTGQEYAQSVPTRLSGGWEVNVAAVSPGAEWLQVGQVTTPSMALKDTRPMYFEGRIDAATASGWGSAADRSDDRSAAAVGDLQTALAALRQSLEDIKGPKLARWYTDHVAGQSIGYAAANLTQSRTSWADDNFYVQGDSVRPRINFGADGAHLAYMRAMGLLVVTGPALGAAAQATTQALAYRSGPENAVVTAGFYRATANGLASGTDASWARNDTNPPGAGIGFYGAAGLMGGAGVGLGATLRGQAPALFVGTANTVGVGHSAAATLAADATLPLQLTTQAGQLRAYAVNDGNTAQALFGLANAVSVVTGSPSFYGALLAMPKGAPLLVTQNGQDLAALRGGIWLFGKKAQTSSQIAGAVNVTDSPTVVASTTDTGAGGIVTNYAQTTTLLLNNNNMSSDNAGVRLPARLTLASVNAAFHIDGSTNNFAITDAVNAQPVLTYSTTTKQLTAGVPLKAGAVLAGAQTSYQFSPAVVHQDTYPGCALNVRAGNPVGTAQSASRSMGEFQVACVQPYGTTTGGQMIEVCWPVRCMTGQQMSSVTVYFYLGSSAFDSSVQMTVGRYSSLSATNNLAGADSLLYQSSLNFGSRSPGIRSMTYSTPNPETCVAFNDWYINILAQSGGNDLQINFKYATVQMITPTLNPQRQ